MNFYSNGKLLITGEYVVLDGAKSLAVPTKFGQDLQRKQINEPLLVWESYSHNDSCWFEATFDVPTLRLQTATFSSDKEGNAEFIAENLRQILRQAKKNESIFFRGESWLYYQNEDDFSKRLGLGIFLYIDQQYCSMGKS